MVDYALGRANDVEQMTRDALAEGKAVQEVLTDGLIAGMGVVGEDFKHNVLYVPEVLIAARAARQAGATGRVILICASTSAMAGVCCPPSTARSRCSGGP